ncbi:MAG: response regulator transcription factor [Nitrospirae bacterium]|nr:MAG: response regulator transcription factor [Nitrospirota bacterium]
MPHSPKRQGQYPSALPSPELVQGSLRQFMISVESVLHPTLYNKMLRQVGVSLGRHISHQYQETHGSHEPLSRQDYIRCIEGVTGQWGWECSAEESTAGAITFNIPACPFGGLATDVHSVCQIESGILGGIAGDHFGQSKVTVHRGQGSPPKNCRLVVYPHRSEQSVAAEGTVYPEESHRQDEQGLGTTLESDLAMLSPRERQVLRLVGEGLANKKIAAVLHLSVRTVEGHLSRIHSKLEVGGRTNLIRLALRSKRATR